MLTSPGLPTISESEVLWAKDVEDAFLEALKLYSINGPKWIYKDGKKLGRNKLISEDIKKKCGKILTGKQISSHIQVYKQRNKVKEANKSLTKIKVDLFLTFYNKTIFFRDL
uniref:TEA domain-containing protein n=1 Tax=Acrobeloides nanus TaxID=290746 RepID=A0A914CCW6_9BILA